MVDRIASYGRQFCHEVCFWNLTDNPTAPAFVRYWSNSGHWSALAPRGLGRDLMKAVAVFFAASLTNSRDHNFSLLRDTSCSGFDQG
jgi:hypothetical protein